MKKKGFIFFDIGSTLMDGPLLSPAGRFVESLNLPLGEKERINEFLFTENIADPRDLLRRLEGVFPSLPGDAYERIDDIWRRQEGEGFILPGALKVIREARLTGFGLGIISNIWEPYFRCFSRLFEDYMEFFSVLSLSYREGAAKPDRRLFDRALDKIPPGEYGLGEGGNIWMAGDSYYHDMEPAIKMGLKTLWVNTQSVREEEFSRQIESGKIEAPRIVVDSLEKFSVARLLNFQD